MSERGWMTDMKRKEQLENEALKSDQQEGIQSEPVKIETEGVFNQDYLDQSDREVANPGFLSGSEMDAFIDNPMVAMIKPLITEYFQAIRPKPLELPKAEHKVRIFRLNDRASLSQIENAIEEFLNDGYCCHMPTVVNDFVIMDFSRRKETEEDGRNT